MKIILIQNVKNLGKAGDLKEVADGYARNYLITKKLAEIATPENIRLAGERKARQAEDEKKLATENQETAKALKRVVILLKAKEKGGKLFGSVGAKEIAKALKEQHFEIPEKSIILKESIKKIGEHTVNLMLPGKIKSEIKVRVEPV